MKENSTTKALILKSLFIIGIFIIVVILAFSVIRFLPKVFSSFASVGSMITSPFTKGIEIDSDDTEIATGKTFTINWEYKPKDIGEYYIKYECVNDVILNIVTPNGERVLNCDDTYKLGDINQVELKGILNKPNSFVDVKVEILYGTDNANKIESKGDILMSIKNEGQAASNNLSSATVTASDIIPVSNNQNQGVGIINSQTAQPAYVGKADLMVSNISSINNKVTFDISNVGGSATGIWYFSYLITGENLVYSNPQMSLRPGEGIRYTLTFDNQDDESVTVIADALQNVSESNEANNSFTNRFKGLGNNSNNDNDYNRNDDANLEITRLEVGKLNGNSFREDDEIDEDDEAAVRFIVKNTGGENTGSWRYEIANLPYDNDDDYESSSQSSLRPGESREIILSFENIDEGNYSIKVEVDSRDDVDEEDERDNDESERLEVTN